VALEDPFHAHHHLSFAGPRGLVEAHFRLFTGFGGGVFDEAALAARATWAELDGRPIRLLGPEDELLYLATHAANHAFLRLSWLVDLARFIELAPALDWERMARRASRAGFLTASASALRLVDVVLECPLPEGAQRHFPVSAVRRWVDDRLFTPEALLSGRLATDRLGSFLARLWLVDTPAHGLRHVLEGARRADRRSRAER
jgi:hypothetical protein